MSVCVEDRTYTIGHYRVSLSRDRTYTIGHLFVMSVQFEFGAAPISIGHLPISSVRVGTAPISIGHCLVSLSRGRTHIDRPFPYQFVFSLSQDRTHIDRSFILSIRSVRRPGLCFSMTFRVTFSRFGI